MAPTIDGSGKPSAPAQNHGKLGKGKGEAHRAPWTDVEVAAMEGRSRGRPGPAADPEGPPGAT